MKKALFGFLLICSVIVTAQEKKLTMTSAGPANKDYGPLLYFTVVNDDNVNIRSGPSLSENIVKKVNRGFKVKVMGISEKKEKINSDEYYWFLVAEDNSFFDCNHMETIGWIYGKYVDIKGDYLPSKFTTGDDDTEKSLETDIIFTDKNGNRSSYADWFFDSSNDSNLFYLIDIYHRNLSWRDVPGIYRYNKITNTFKHIAYFAEDDSFISKDNGGDSLHWETITNDGKYIIADLGTAAGIRGIVIWDIKTKKLQYKGSYLRSYDLDGDNITVCEEYQSEKATSDQGPLKQLTENDIEASSLDGETKKQIENYISSNPLKASDLEKSNHVDYWKYTINVFYRLNINSLKKTIIKCTSELYEGDYIG
jgi:hypothetical protein